MREPKALTSGRLAVIVVSVSALPLLALANVANLNRLNPDAVAYLMIARYWHDGVLALAVSSYWSPLFSWMVAALMLPLPDVIAAGRAAMAVSGMVFLLGGIAVLRAMVVPDQALGVGAVALLGFAIAWSVRIMTPDLLVSGLLMMAVAAVLHPSWLTVKRRQIAAGIVFGVAYYAKTIGLPLGLAFIVATGVWYAQTGGGARAAMTAAARTGMVMLLVAAPWIGVLSAKSGTPTFGTSGAINFAIAGPSYHGTHPAFTTFYAPREGRVTAWEDPSEMHYASWAPWRSAAAAAYFLRLVRANLEATLATLRGFDLFGLGLAGLLIAPLVAGTGPPRAWRVAVLPVALVAAIYLPVNSDGEPRYLMPTYPFLLAAAGAVLFAIAGTQGRGLALRRIAATLLLTVSFLMPLRYDIAVALTGRANPYFLMAQQVAEAARAAAVPGGVASVGEMGFVAIFTAFLLNRPFVGTEDTLPDLDRLRRLGTGVLIVGRDRPEDVALAGDAHVTKLPTHAATVVAYRLQ